jgi:hypothetical protein
VASLGGKLPPIETRASADFNVNDRVFVAGEQVLVYGGGAIGVFAIR